MIALDIFFLVINITKLNPKLIYSTFDRALALLEVLSASLGKYSESI